MTVSIKNNVNKPRPIERIKRLGLGDILTDVDLGFVIGGSADRRFGVVKRLTARGDLIQVRRGLYVLGELYRSSKIHSFSLAQRIDGPSYISFESALSHWGLIPEAVYTTTSACRGRSRDFNTKFGTFSYVRVPYQPFYTQVSRVDDSGCVYFIASALRALCDYIYVSNFSGSLRDLEKSLRLDEIPKVDEETFNEMKIFFTHIRVQKFLKEYRRRFY